MLPAIAVSDMAPIAAKSKTRFAATIRIERAAQLHELRVPVSVQRLIEAVNASPPTQNYIPTHGQMPLPLSKLQASLQAGPPAVLNSMMDIAI
jgi:hypothetical protein